MANLTEQVPLPHSVEQLLDRICREQNQTPLDSNMRRKLADIGEESAVHILSQISSKTIRRSLAGYICCLIRSPSTTTSPNKGSCVSPNATPAFTTHRMITQGNTSSLRAQGGEEILMNRALVALGELEFRKAFLLLNYIGGESLERAITVDKIRSLKALPMRKFEEEVWEALGKNYLSDHRERRLSHEWDSGKPYVYHCHVSPNGSLRFKGPFIHEARTHLQKTLGDDNVLIVKFAEERHGWAQRTSFEEAYALYGRFGKEGIRVGLRLYQFFGNL